MIKAKIRDRELLGEVAQFEDDSKHFHLWWLGQSGYLLMYRGEKMLIDPYLSDSLTRKYADTDKPHIRMSERVIDPELLTGISIVTSSHNHTDHLDAETLMPVLKNNPAIKLVVPEANRKFVAERLQCSDQFPLGLDAGTSFQFNSFTIHGVPAKHNELEKDEHGRCKFMGYVIQFGEWTIYHSGDTLLYDGMVDLLRKFKINVALLPINGNDPARKVAGNLDAQEAAWLAKSIGAEVVIPCHYDMFTFNTADPANFIIEANKIAQPYKILPPGGHFSSAQLPL